MKPPDFKPGEVLTADALNALAASITHSTQASFALAGQAAAATDQLLPLATAATTRVSEYDLVEPCKEPGIYTHPFALLDPTGRVNTCIGTMTDCTFGECVIPCEQKGQDGTVYADVETTPYGEITCKRLKFYPRSEPPGTYRLPDPAKGEPGMYHYPLADVKRATYWGCNTVEQDVVTLRQLGDMQLPTVIVNDVASGQGAAAPSCSAAPVTSPDGTPCDADDRYAAHSARLSRGHVAQVWSLRQLTEGGGVCLEMPNPQDGEKLDWCTCTVPDEIIIRSGVQLLSATPMTSDTGTSTGCASPWEDADACWCVEGLGCNQVRPKVYTPGCGCTCNCGWKNLTPLCISDGKLCFCDHVRTINLQAKQVKPWAFALRFKPNRISLSSLDCIRLEPTAPCTLQNNEYPRPATHTCIDYAVLAQWNIYEDQTSLGDCSCGETTLRAYGRFVPKCVCNDRYLAFETFSTIWRPNCNERLASPIEAP